MPRILRKSSTLIPHLGILFNDPPGDGAGGGGGAPAGGGAPGGKPAGGDGGSDKGYPDNTPVADMNDAQKAAYYLAQSRKWEDQARGKAEPTTDFLKGLKSAADKAAELEAAGKSEAEKATAAAVEQAKKETREATLREASESTAKTLLEGALKVRGHKDVASALQFVNVNAFVKDGEVDHDQIVAYADQLAGKPGETKGPDFGSGRRGNPTGAKPGDAGRAEAERRYPKKTTTSS